MYLRSEYLLDGEHLIDKRKFDIKSFDALMDSRHEQYTTLGLSNEAQSRNNEDNSGRHTSPLVVDAEPVDDDASDVLSGELDVPQDYEEVLDTSPDEPQDSTECEADDIEFIEVECI